MKRLAVVAIGALVASVIALTPGGTAGADHPDGLGVDPDAGVPGDEIDTQVDPDAVEDSCVTVANYDEVYTAFLGAVGAAIGGPIPNPPDSFPGDYEDVAAMILAGAVVPGLGDAEAAAAFLASTYLLSFVEIATQDPVGDMGGFDPTTGAGTIEVPEELTPGLWALAAFCVEPNPENLAAALAAGAAALEAEFGDFPDFGPDLFEMLGQLEDVGPAIGAAMFGQLMEPSHTWTSPFTVPDEPVVPSPENEAFCAVLPALSPLGADISAALAALPEDTGQSQEDWVADHDWEEIGDELEELFDAATELIAEGDETRADEVADDWATVTEGLRAARNALEAVDYDLSTESGRAIAGQLREGATAEGDNTEVEDATAALTAWFVDNCIPAAPAPADETPRSAPAAQPVTAAPTFAG